MEVTFPSSKTSSNFWVTSQTLKKSAHSHLKHPPHTHHVKLLLQRDGKSAIATVYSYNLRVFTMANYSSTPGIRGHMVYSMAYLLSLMLGVWNLTYLLKSLKIGREFDY